MDCPYCSLPQIKERKIIENKLAWAFPGNMPITPGHVLVVPKRHVVKYEELTMEEKEAIENLRVKVINALKKTFNTKEFNFAWNDGKIAGQSVPHFHLHIVPRKEGDSGIYEYEPRKFLYRPGERETTPEEELKKVSKLIYKNITTENIESINEDFDKWNKKKKELSKRKRVYFQKGDIWFTSIGKNIGDEEDGKHSDFERPVLVVRKFNNNIFLGIPLTSNKIKDGKYYHRLVSFYGSVLILSQSRLFDAKRLLRFMGKVDNTELKEIKLKIGNIV